MVVHLGKEDFLPRYKLYVTHIAEWRQQFQNVQSVDLRYEGQVIVNPDKPAETAEKPLPRMNADNADQKKPVLKTVSAKTAAASTKPAIAKQTTKPAAKPVVKKATSKPVAKKTAAKADKQESCSRRASRKKRRQRRDRKNLVNG